MSTPEMSDVSLNQRGNTERQTELGNPTPPRTKSEADMSDEDLKKVLADDEKKVELDESSPLVQGEKKKKEPLSLAVKICYGIGEIGIYVPTAIENLFFPTFLLEVAGLEASRAAVVLLIAQLYNAFFGPFVGYFSDQTRTRWGRRKPFIAGACGPAALTWFALWQNPGKYLMAYYLFFLMAYNTAHSMLAVSYTSLTPEISKDYNERTQLTVFRFGISMAATLVYTFLHAYLIEAFDDPDNPDVIDYEKGYSLSAGILATIILISSVILIFGTPNGTLPKKKKRVVSEGTKFEVFLLTFKKAFAIRSFVALLFVYLLGWSSICFMQANLVLWVKYQLKLEQYLSLILLSVQTFSILGFPCWGMLSRRLEKRTCYFIGVGLFIPIMIGLFFLPQSTHIWTACIMAGMAGFMMSMLFVIPWSMVPDVVDETEMVLGDRRDGIFYSTFIVFNKTGVAISLFMSSFLLGLVGYDSPVHQTSSEASDDEQDKSVLLMLRILMGLLPAVLLSCASIPMSFYNISRDRHTEILKVVEAERERKTTLKRVSKAARSLRHSAGEDLSDSDDDSSDSDDIYANYASAFEDHHSERHHHYSERQPYHSERHQ